MLNSLTITHRSTSSLILSLIKILYSWSSRKYCKTTGSIRTRPVSSTLYPGCGIITKDYTSCLFSNMRITSTTLWRMLSVPWILLWILGYLEILLKLLKDGLEMRLHCIGKILRIIARIMEKNGKIMQLINTLLTWWLLNQWKHLIKSQIIISSTLWLSIS